jgi:small multidrug resistance family-3 protein
MASRRMTAPSYREMNQPRYCLSLRRKKFPNVKELIAVHAGRIQRAGMNLYKNTGTGDQMKTITLYFATAIAEIVGCYLPWLWLKQNGSPWLLIPAGVSLAAFAWLLTLHEAATGRVYAAYGGVYIFAAILWLWAVDGIRPSNWDVAGVAVALLGMSIIAFQPR